jgi:hypothetical protein
MMIDTQRPLMRLILAVVAILIVAALIFTMVY